MAEGGTLPLQLERALQHTVEIVQLSFRSSAYTRSGSGTLCRS